MPRWARTRSAAATSPGGQDVGGLQPEPVAAQPVVQEVQVPVLDEERVPTGPPAVGQQHTLRPAVGDDDVGGDAPRPVVGLRGGGERHRRPAGVEHELLTRAGDGRLLDGQPVEHVTVEGQDLVLLGLGPPPVDELGELVGVLGGHVAGLGPVLGEVVELPPVSLEGGQAVGGDRGAEPQAPLGGLGEARAGPRADRAPPVVVDRAVAHHLEVLGVVVARRMRRR